MGLLVLWIEEEGKLGERGERKTYHTLSWVDGERYCVSAEKANDDRHEGAGEIDGLEVVWREGVVAGDETEVVGEVRRVWALSLHVPLRRLFLLLALEGEWEAETTTWDLCLAEIAETGFEALEVGDQFISRHGQAVVEEGYGCAAADCVYETCFEPVWGV